MIGDWAVETCNVTKTFRGGVVAVSGLDLRVGRGTVCGLVGRNGAGKTTTLRLVMGLLQPNDGAISIFGVDPCKAPRPVRARIAYVSQTQQLKGWMTLGELCRYAGYFYESWDQAYAHQLARRWDLSCEHPVHRFSGGQQRKVCLLLALAARPELLLLDEPVAGLDPIARRQFIDEMVDLISRGDGSTVVFSTHFIGDLERIAESIAIMDRGRILTAEALEDLQNSIKRVQIIFPGPAPEGDLGIPGILRRQALGSVATFLVRLKDERQLEPLRQMPGVRVQVFPLGLEELFIALLGDEPPNRF